MAIDNLSVSAEGGAILEVLRVLLLVMAGTRESVCERERERGYSRWFAYQCW